VVLWKSYTSFLYFKVVQKWDFCHHLLTFILFQTWMTCFFHWNTKKDYLRNVLMSQVFFVLQWKSTVTKYFWLQTLFKTSYFVFRRREKVIKVWKDMVRVSEWFFWWTIPLRGQHLFIIFNIFISLCTSVVWHVTWTGTFIVNTTKMP